MSRFPSQIHARRFWLGLPLVLLLAVCVHADPTATLTATPNPVKETKPFELIATATTTLPGETITHTKYQEISPAAVVVYDSSVTLSVSLNAPSVSATTTVVYELTVTSLDTLGVTRTFTVTHNVTVNNNVAPVANAGADFSVRVQKQAQLNGSGTDSDGTVVGYRWFQTAGATVTLSNVNIPNPTFMSPAAAGSLTFGLVVTDDNGANSSTNTVVVTVQANSPPVVNAGPATVTVNEGQLVVSSSATATDANGDPLSYSWSEVSGPQTVVINSSTSLTGANFIAPTVSSTETYVFRLSVTDGLAIASDTITVNVLHINHPPVANAGPNQSVTEGALVHLTAAGSTDPDGDTLAFAWAQNSTPAGQPPVTLTSSNTVSPSFIAPGVTLSGSILRFRVTVTDGKGGSSTATVDVQVQNSSAPNHPPVVNAGVDQTVDAKATVTLKGTASDPDGTAVAVTWSKQSGPHDITIDNATALQASFVAPESDQDALYVIQLSGTDGFLVATDTMTVLVRAAKPSDASAGLPLIANPKIYPSPFSPAAGGAKIGYTLRSPSDVTVLISDIFGREVKEITVLAGATGGTAGDNALPWDGRSGDGEEIGNGAYVVQIQATDANGSKGKISDRVGVRR